MKDNLVTVYTPGSGFGNLNRYEGKLLKHGTKKYAQFNNAPFVEIVPKGKRKPLSFLKAYKPMILILEGHQHPEPASLYKEAKFSSPDVVVSESRYAACDDRWDTDFDKLIDAYIAKTGASVIADYRHTKGFNSY